MLTKIPTVSETINMHIMWVVEVIMSETPYQKNSTRINHEMAVSLVTLTIAGESITVQVVTRDTGALEARQHLSAIVITSSIVTLTLICVWRGRER